jgi:mRNA deadenylase 3'-5' endonuclease subunit Ccr4
VEPQFDKDKFIISLKKNYIRNDEGPREQLILESPIKMKSAYANLLKQEVRKLDEKYRENRSKRSIMEEIEINSIKMSANRIIETKSFLSELTHEPPFTMFARGTMCCLDYIFYLPSNISLERTLNIPDVMSILYDIGPLPNKIFPSDHISMAADFKINN